MNIKGKVAALLAPVCTLLVLVTLLALPARAQAPIYHAFWGEVRINGQLAPIGAKIEAKGANVVGSVDNPLTTTAIGHYGGAGAFDAKLVVQGSPDIPVANGTPLRFYVNDMRAECQPEGGAWGLTYSFASGTTTQLNLRLVSPVLRISKLDSTTAHLSWDAVAGAASYALYRSTSPYFAPTDTDPPYQTITGLLYYDDAQPAGALGNPNVNYFYLLKAVYDVGKGMASNRVGEFDFSLTPGA